MIRSIVLDSDSMAQAYPPHLCAWYCEACGWWSDDAGVPESCPQCGLEHVVAGSMPMPASVNLVSLAGLENPMRILALRRVHAMRLLEAQNPFAGSLARKEGAR